MTDWAVGVGENCYTYLTIYFEKIPKKIHFFSFIKLCFLPVKPRISLQLKGEQWYRNSIFLPYADGFNWGFFFYCLMYKMQRGSFEGWWHEFSLAPTHLHHLFSPKRVVTYAYKSFKVLCSICQIYIFGNSLILFRSEGPRPDFSYPQCGESVCGGRLERSIFSDRSVCSCVATPSASSWKYLNFSERC